LITDVLDPLVWIEVSASFVNASYLETSHVIPRRNGLAYYKKYGTWRIRSENHFVCKMFGKPVQNAIFCGSLWKSVGSATVDPHQKKLFSKTARGITLCSLEAIVGIVLSKHSGGEPHP
jgi:hypothetical protein